MDFIPPEEIWVEESVYFTPLAERVRNRAVNISCRIIPDPAHANNGDPVRNPNGRRVLMLNRHRGSFLNPCSCSAGSVSCGAEQLKVVGNCSTACSYCKLQFLLASPTVTIHANLDDMVRELDEFFREHPERRLRVGTNDCVDALDLEPLTGYAADLIKIFARWPNATLELRTKTNHVDQLIGLHPGNTVISWPLNPPDLIRAEDRRTATLEQRLEAATRVAEAGYHVGFHFDPMVHCPNWQASYVDVLDMIGDSVGDGHLVWISLGALRFPPAIKQTVQRRFPGSTIFDGEFVIGHDGKMRYFTTIRVEMFRFMLEQIRQRFPHTAVYLCMEPPEIWQRVLGREPQTCEILEETLKDTG